MSTKLNAMRQVVIDLGTVFPTLTTWQEIYLTPKIMAIDSMANLELQVCEGGSEYPEHDGSCRSEDFIVRVGLFCKYRLDSGGRHSKALADLTVSIFNWKQIVIDLLDGSFLTADLLTRPLIIRTESEVSETKQDGQLLKTLNFLAGLNTSML